MSESPALSIGSPSRDAVWAFWWGYILRLALSRKTGRASALREYDYQFMCSCSYHASIRPAFSFCSYDYEDGVVIG